MSESTPEESPGDKDQSQTQEASASGDRAPWLQDLFDQSAALDAFTAVPTLPSELLGSYSSIAALPASQLDPYSRARELSPALPINRFEFHNVQDATLRNKSSADVINDMINQQLGRVSMGDSVVEPDSILGESGRLYHGYKEGTYLLPNDAAEQDRLDLQHEIFRLCFDGWLALAPLTAAPEFVLDVATGTGLWVHEFAEQNPSSFVIGTDLSSIQPLPRTPNCAFVKADAEDSWIFPDSNADHASCTPGTLCEHLIKFDYVHLRMVVTCFNDTRTVIANAYDNMKPNGWIEFQDISFKYGQANPDYKNDAFMRCNEGCVKGAAALGRNLEKTWKYQEWVKEAGFVDVTERQFILPIGPWPQEPKLKKVGLYNLSNMYDGVRGISWKMLQYAGYTPEEIESLITDVQAELRDPQNYAYSVIYVVYGRKPTVEEIQR
ncbi:S-adenosyl-L-methionine-dependent methyltransferase [Xylariales sp. PMI_506]|nr:S-adenosyl-L-methionine-dependent methyltransferase [Xylariales sp. PMI_506]